VGDPARDEEQYRRAVEIGRAEPQLGEVVTDMVQRHDHHDEARSKSTESRRVRGESEARNSELAV
jgi:hypothetical protein